MKAKRLALGILPLGLLVLLAACTQTQSTGTSSSVSFTVVSDTTTYAVLQNSDGTVNSTKTIDRGTHTVTFTNVPSGAMITALATRYGYGEKNQSAFTVPASLIAGQTLLGNYVFSYGSVNISGPCPTGSTTTTQIYYQSSYAPGAYWNSSYTNCSSTNTFSIPNAYYDGIGTNGNAGITLFARNGTTVSAYTRLSFAPTTTTMTIVSGDWSTSGLQSNNSSVSFAMLGSGESAYVYRLIPFAKGNGLWAAAGNAMSNSTGSGSSIALTGSAVDLSGASSYLLSLDFERDTCTTNCVYSYVYKDATQSSLPVNASLTIGTDTYPTLPDLTWSANATTPPVMTYTGSSKLSTAVTRDAYVDVYNSASNTYKSWEMISGGGDYTTGPVKFPQLPSSLQSYIPVPNASGANNYGYVDLSDVDLATYWSGPWPDTYNEAGVSTYNATVANLSNGVPHRPLRGPAPGIGMWIK